MKYYINMGNDNDCFNDAEEFLEQVLQSFPEINKVKSVFENVTQQGFIKLVKIIIDKKDYNTTQRFLYFLFLFRDMKHIREYLNSEEFDIDLLEKFVFFTYGYYTINGYSVEWIFDKIFCFVNNERLLDLVLYSKVISNDRMMFFIILSEFNVDLLDAYFAQITNAEKIINSFLRLPDEVLKTIITRNYHLFEYIMLMVSVSAIEEKESEEFYNKYRVDLDLFSKLNNFIEEYNEKYDEKYIAQNEKNLPFHKRDMNRISYLVNMIRGLPNFENSIEYFYNEHIIIDETEKYIVRTIITDPLYKNTFTGNRCIV